MVVPDANKLKGISSLDDLKTGDELVIEGEQTAEGFQVDSLQRAGAEEQAERSRISEEPKSQFLEPDAGDEIGTPAIERVYSWQEKLGRGAVNIVTSPVEIARGIQVGAEREGLAYGWTAGLVQGFAKGFVRLGAGALDLLTFPFDFPQESKAPLVEPEFAWEKPGAKYL
jgi:putative exosortase-associated protein (TIGR04073 family)